MIIDKKQKKYVYSLVEEAIGEIGYVYLFKNFHSLIKIGMTRKCPLKRARDIENTGGSKIEILHYLKFSHCRQIEQKMHYTFHDKRRIGEWFDISEEEARAELERMHRRYRAFIGEIPSGMGKDERLLFLRLRAKERIDFVSCHKDNGLTFREIHEVMIANGAKLSFETTRKYYRKAEDRGWDEDSCI